MTAAIVDGALVLTVAGASIIIDHETGRALALRLAELYGHQQTLDARNAGRVDVARDTAERLARITKWLATYQEETR